MQNEDCGDEVWAHGGELNNIRDEPFKGRLQIERWNCLWRSGADFRGRERSRRLEGHFASHALLILSVKNLFRSDILNLMSLADVERIALELSENERASLRRLYWKAWRPILSSTVPMNLNAENARWMREG